MNTLTRHCSKCDYQYPSLEEPPRGGYTCPHCGEKATVIKQTLQTSVGLTSQIPAVVIVSTVWLHWIEIGLDHEELARKARVAAVATADSAVTSAELTSELRASMTAIAAASHSIDALYGSLSVPQTIRDKVRKLFEDVERVSRHSYIIQALQRSFKLDNPTRKRWGKDFRWLFGLRDAAVHAREAYQVPQPHPVGTRTSPEYLTYSVENAVRAIDICLDVVKSCLSSPRADVPSAVEWSRLMMPSVEQLERRRDEIRQIELPPARPVT